MTPNGAGTAVSTYTVTAYDGPTPAGSCTPVASNSSTCTGLTNGTPYTFKVTAANANGGTSTSLASSPATPLAAPAAPLSVSAVAGAAQATATVVPPVSTTNVDHYRIQVSTNAALFCDTVGLATSCNITGLTNGTPYAFTATSVNANGTASTPTAASTPTVTPLALPDVPAGIAAVTGASAGVVSVTVTAAGAPGPVDHYHVEVDGDPSLFCDTDTGGVDLTCDVTGLLADSSTTYTFIATAVNANGGVSTSTTSASTPGVLAGV